MFRIDVLDAGNNVVGDGPLTNVQQVQRTRKLDVIGGLSFAIPGTDPRSALVVAGRKYRLYHYAYGTLGTFSHKKQSLNIGGNGPSLRVDADDQLIELVRKSVYFRRNYDHVAVDTVVGALTGLVSGWSMGTNEASIGNTTVSYEGESVFEALDVLRDRWGRHFRLAGDQVLDFGSFGDDSGLRLLRAEAVPRELADNDDVAFVTNLEILTESDQVINRIIPMGAGAGVTQLTLQHVTSTDASYPVQTTVNADGTTLYYIEDTTSQASYGVIERTVERSDIRPLTNSDTNTQNAANALYRAALRTLLHYKDPRTHYRVQVTKLNPTRLQPGDKIRLAYRGIATQQGQDYKWVDVDDDLWVLDIAETYAANGQQTVALTVATSSDRRTSDSDVLSKLVRDTKVLKSHVQPNLTHSPVGPYVKRMDSSRTASFNIRLKEEVQAVNRVILRFITNPLRSSVSGSAGAAGGGTTATSDGGGSGVHTSASGGSATPTSASGGAATPTSASGGAATPTSAAGAAHTHDAIDINRVLTSSLNSDDKPLYFDQVDEDIKFPSEDSGLSTHTKTSSSEAVHTHSVSVPAHTHSVSVPAHTHSVSIPNHTHDVTIPNHTHDVTLGDHTHTLSLQYGIHEDTVYPQVISVTINGTDRTIVLGGTWAPSNAGVDIEVDVTDYINRGQDNTVVFSCTTGQGEITFLADCLLTIQAIVVT